MGLAGLAVVISSLWIAICAAAPELIWRGAQIALSHVSLEDLLSALLIGLVLAFFIEPMMERLRHLLSRGRHPDTTDDKPHNPLFTGGVSLVFAFASVCLHEAMTAYVSGHGADQSAAHTGLAAGIALTIAWAMVPFFITLAWLSARNLRVTVPLGILAGASTFIAGWLFSWTPQDVIATAIPCVLILCLGYRQAIKEPRRRVLMRCTYIVAVVAAIWLALSLLLLLIPDFAGSDRFRLYKLPQIWVDARFYFGWVLGLALAPSPYYEVGDAKQETPPPAGPLTSSQP